MTDLRSKLQDSWSRALLAASTVEEQAQALAGRVQHLIDGAAPAQLVSEITGKLQAQRVELQSQVQKAIESALDRMKLPSKHDVEALRSRLADMEARLSSIEKGASAGGGRPSA